MNKRQWISIGKMRSLISVIGVVTIVAVCLQISNANVSSRFLTKEEMLGLSGGQCTGQCWPMGTDCSGDHQACTPGNNCLACPSSRANFGCTSPLIPYNCSSTAADLFCAFMTKSTCPESGLCPPDGELTNFKCWAFRCV